MPADRACFGRDRRVLKGDDFGAILKAGGRGATPLVSIAVTPTHGMGRIGISASAKVGGSVERNRARRMVREYYRQTFKGSAPYDIVVNLKPGFAELSTSAARTTLNEAIAKAVASGARAGRRPRPVH